MRRSPGRSRRPITARSGWTATGWSSSSRTVSSGSSTSTVWVPTSIVSHSPRSRWVSRRAARLETQRLVPSAAALRPSRVVANFQVTKGRRCAIAKVHVRLIACASSTRRPPSTSTPASRSRAAPPTATGFASVWANTTRRTPAAISASLHGPVRPVWLHGSRVTTAVAPRAASPASASATTSACGAPARRWKPSAIVVPSGGEQHAPDPRVGSEGYARGDREREGAAHRPLLGLVDRHPLPSVRSRTHGGEDGARPRAREPSACASHPDFDRRSRIFTWSTGHWRWSGRGLPSCLGHRRCGVSPPPEHAALSGTNSATPRRIPSRVSGSDLRLPEAVASPRRRWGPAPIPAGSGACSTRGRGHDRGH